MTVEQGPGGAPEASQTPVSSPDEAGAVAEQKASDGDVVAVEVDKPVHSDTATDPRRNEQWALDRVNFEGAWLTTNGTGETVAVVDTGVQQSHVDLSGQVQNGQYFLHDPNGNALEGPGGTTDDNSHGTHVAGIIAAVADNNPAPLGIAGAAPGVQILPVKVLDSTGSGWTSDVANGITWAAQNGANVINLSLGGPGFLVAEQTAIQNARNGGVVVVAAAGNEGQNGNTVSYPGNFPEVIAVGATTSSNAVAYYSTSCPYVDLAAPGGEPSGNSSISVLSTVPGANDDDYGLKAGTSMATPHVAAAAALVQKAHPTFTPVQVCTQLIRTASDLGPAGKDNGFGYGQIQPDFAVGQEDPSGPTCA